MRKAIVPNLSQAFLCAPISSFLVSVVHGDQKGHPGDDPMKTQNGTDSHCTESVVAAFLIAVEQGAILGCNDWQVYHALGPIVCTHLLPAC